MSGRLLEIHPGELKFTFELKKQSSCAIHLSNVTDQYVAFKVKTTSPNKYCVRPNVGIIKPKSVCDFTVTMQAQRSASSDLECKDKFLIQSTVVPFGTTEDDVASDVFSKGSGKYVEENKMRVVLISPPHSPVLLHINRALEQEAFYEKSPKKEKLQCGDENTPPSHMLSAVNMKDLELAKVVVEKELNPAKNMRVSPMKDLKVESAKDAEDAKLNLTNEMEELKLKALTLEYKLNEAKVTISDLNHQNSTILEAKETLNLELARRRNGVRKVERGFSFLFVCMVALIHLAIGYLVHP